jgi:hypothetical protein
MNVAHFAVYCTGIRNLFFFNRGTLVNKKLTPDLVQIFLQKVVEMRVCMRIRDPDLVNADSVRIQILI